MSFTDIETELAEKRREEAENLMELMERTSAVYQQFLKSVTEASSHDHLTFAGACSELCYLQKRLARIQQHINRCVEADIRLKVTQHLTKAIERVATT